MFTARLVAFRLEKTTVTNRAKICDGWREVEGERNERKISAYGICGNIDLELPLDMIPISNYFF